MWWWKHALFELRTSPFVDPESFVPAGRENGRSELTVTNTIPALPITWLAGPVAAYNVMVLASFVSTAFFTYLWVAGMTGRRAAGVVAGTVAAFLPLRFAHLAGHLPQMTTQWIALTLYAFDRYVDRRSLRRALALGAGVALTVLGCWYYGYALAVMLPIYAILRTRRLGVWRERGWWLGLIAAGLVAGAVAAPFVYHMALLQREGALTRTLGAMDFWSLNLYDLFIPNLLHPLFGEAASRWFPVQRELWVERGVTLGYVALALAIGGWFWGRRQRAPIAGLLGTWIAASVIALGPTVHWGDHQVRVPLGETIAGLAGGALKGTGGDTATVRDSFARDGVPIPLPALLMYKFVPLTSSMRVMARFAIWTGLMTAALAGFGVVWLVASAERRWGAAARVAVPGLLVALVAFESLATIPVMPLGPRPVDTWLAGEPRTTVIVELPVDQAQRSLQNYWMTQNQKPNLFGWIGDSFPPPPQVARAAALKDFPAPATLDYLRRSPATYLLVTPSDVPNWSAMEPVLAASPALTDARTIGGVRLYRVVH